MNNNLIITYFDNYSDFLKLAIEVCNSKDIADDIMQTTYIRIQNKTCINSNPINYIKTTIRNLVRDYRKMNRKYNYIIDDPGIYDIFQIPDTDKNSEELLIDKEHRKHVLQFLNSLPKRQMIISLEMSKGLSLEKVAENCGFTYNQVKDSWKEISNKLKKELNQKDL